MLFEQVLMRILAAVHSAGILAESTLLFHMPRLLSLQFDNVCELENLTGSVGKGQQRLKGHSSDMYVSLGK